MIVDTNFQKWVESLSQNYKKALPNVKGLNQQNLRYAEKFYTLYKYIFPQPVGELTMVPWGRHRIIIDKCKTLSNRDNKKASDFSDACTYY